jgi:hypothetical protein
MLPRARTEERGGSCSVHRATSRAACALLLAIGILATGCEIQGFRVRLKNFTATATEGLWVWQRSPATRKFERHSVIEFGRIYEAGGSEYMTYTFSTGAEPIGLQTLVERAPGNSDTLTLNLAFAAVGSGVYRMSSFNAVGESALSTRTLAR